MISHDFLMFLPPAPPAARRLLSPSAVPLDSSLPCSGLGTVSSRLASLAPRRSRCRRRGRRSRSPPTSSSPPARAAPGARPQGAAAAPRSPPRPPPPPRARRPRPSLADPDALPEGPIRRLAELPPRRVLGRRLLIAERMRALYRAVGAEGRHRIHVMLPPGALPLARPSPGRLVRLNSRTRPSSRASRGGRAGSGPRGRRPPAGGRTSA